MVRNSTPVRLGMESLEDRALASVSSVWFSGTTLVVGSNSSATNVTLSAESSNVAVRDNSSGQVWRYALSQVAKVEFQGGIANDRFVNNISTMPVKLFGGDGNDYLEGYNADDYFGGGAGNDTMVGYGGNDLMYGGAGNDVFRGGNGNDQMVGEDGDDRLNGAAGNDSAWGGNGNDVLIAIDGATGDYTEGGVGRDIIWVDQIGSAIDVRIGVTTDDKVQQVSSFRNGADRTLDGDSISDPLASGKTYRSFSGNVLFSSSGPSASDVYQGGVGDCWLLAGLGAIAQDNAFAIRSNVVDFDDGTYGVALGGSFYRVDADLAVNGTSTSPAYAKLGRENSMWVAITEKAYAHFRTGANSYASLDGGWGDDVNRAFGSTAAGSNSFSNYSSTQSLANDLYNRWNTYQAVTVGLHGVKSGSTGGLITGHAYTVIGFARNSAGNVTSVTIRNPWGYDATTGSAVDSNSSDGLITLSLSQLAAYTGTVYYGRV